MAKRGHHAERDIRLLAIGRRIAVRLEQAGQRPAEFLHVPGSLSGVTALVQELLVQIEGWREELEQRPWPMRVLPTYTLDWDTLFAELIREYFFVTLFRAFTESLASENASRLASMQAAEKNIEEQLDELNNQYHHLRQSSITEELMDVVAGYKVLSEDSASGNG